MSLSKFRDIPENRSGVSLKFLSSKNDKDNRNTEYGSTHAAHNKSFPYDPIVTHEYIDGNLTDEGYENYSDGEAFRYRATDEFGEHNDFHGAARTGRLRRKLAARTKGGEFQASRKKRRVHFCCICSEIDIQRLHDELQAKGGWTLKLYGDVLRLFRVIGPNAKFPKRLSSPSALRPQLVKRASYDDKDDIEININHRENSSHQSNAGGAQEIFVFEFGAAVFWGFSKSEDTEYIDYIRRFVMKGMLSDKEFEQVEDDMGFVTSSEAEAISIANDVITLPESTVEKQRLAVSYAIAQSTILGLFEARVEKKVIEYKYIPETLANRGRIFLSNTKIGKMIGEVFVIRHDLNLHSDILDTPDFFWKEEKVEPEYKMVMRYLEMDGRVTILNTRLDMLRELLDVLQQQMESAHATKLEWIVIWLILIEIAIEVAGIIGQVLGLWTTWKLF